MRFLRNKELRLHVDSENPVDFLFLDRLQVSKVLDTGIAHDDIDSSKLLLGLVKEIGDLFASADVRPDANSLDSELASFGGNRFGRRLGRDIVHDDVSPA